MSLPHNPHDARPAFDVQSAHSEAIRRHVTSLHRQKDAAYGNAWKKRGELTSILANIARKVDRLTHFVRTGTALVGEAVLDTSVDLLAYTAKYKLFVLESATTEAAVTLPRDAPRPFSDHSENFDTLIAQCDFDAMATDSLLSLVEKIDRVFDNVHECASTPGTNPKTKLLLVTELACLASRLVRVAWSCSEESLAVGSDADTREAGDERRA